MKTDQLIEIIENKLKGWWVYIVQMSPNFMVAIIVLVLFYVGARLLRKFTSNFVFRISKSPSVSGLLSGLVYFVMIITGLMTALNILELDKTVSGLLAGVGIIGLALGFAFQDITSNFISGAYIALQRPFDVGHIVETNGFVGIIEEIQLRATTMKTSVGLHVIIPNKDIFQKPIINYSRSDGRRVELEFAIPSTTDVGRLEHSILDALYEIKEKHGIYGVEFYFTAIENPNIKINVSFWTKKIDQRDFMTVRHKAIKSIFDSLKEIGVYKV